MLSKQGLKNELKEISENAVFIKFVFVSSEQFSIQLKCKVDPDQSDYNQYVMEWIKNFSEITSTTWIVRNSFPNRKRMVYRKVYVCHRSSFNKKTKQTPDHTRNQGCLAKIDFRVKFINRNTIKNDPHLKEGLNLTISIDFVHSHKLRTAEAFNFLKCTSETNEIFHSYLTNGYSLIAAKLYHELTVIDRYGNNPEYLMNANINPTARHVRYLYEKFKKNSDASQSFEQILASKKDCLERAGGFIYYDNAESVVVVTATMKRVISSFSMEHIIIESVPITDIVVTFFYVPSKAGALPVACVLHREHNEASYTQAFHVVILTIESICYGFEPKTITVPEDNDVRNAAKTIFQSNYVSTSKWSICRKIWQWLHGDDIKIENKKRHITMELFSNMIRSHSLKDAHTCYLQLKDDETVQSSIFVTAYLEMLCETQQQWFCPDEESYMKLVEVSLCLMNEFIYRKCKSFNIYVMIDVVTNIIDSQIRHILHDLASGGNIGATYTRFLVSIKATPEIYDLNRIGENEFQVESQTMSKNSISIRVDTFCCDCAIGSKGRFCGHLCFIINTNFVELIRPCELTDEEKCLFTEIAGADFEQTKQIKSEDSKISENYSDNNEIDDCYDDTENGSGNDDMEKETVASPKLDDDQYYYLDVKTENCEDPLEEPSIDYNEEKCVDPSNSATDIYDMPSTSKEIEGNKVELKRKYEDAMRTLNDEFRRLNKYFKQNPNKSNMETMVRLARELSKIRPVERVDFSNMQIKINTVQSEMNTWFKIPG